MTNESPTPKTRGRSHNIIRGGDGKKILYDSDNDQNKKSSNIIRSGDGKRILYEDKGVNDKE